MKIVINPKEKQFETFIQSVPEVFEKEGKTIYKERNEIKVFEVSGMLINVKKYKVPHLINRIAYSFFRRSKAERAYLYALKLREAGIETPEPIAYILIKKDGLLHASYYISKQVDYDHTMYEFGQGGIAGREHIIKAFAAFTVGLHRQGVCHKDYSPGNILFKEQNGKVDFCVVDINRMQFGEVSVKKGCANFARLWGQKDFFLLLAKEYAYIRDIEPDECSKWVLYYRNKFWKRYIKKQSLPFDMIN